ncbi:MAG: hypothetical protein WCP97_08605 [bacterium]
MPQLTWDSLLLVIMLGGALLGFLLRKAKIITYIISCFIAFVFANELGVGITRALRSFTNADIKLFYLKFVLFMFVLLALMTEEKFMSNGVSVPMGIFPNLEGALYGWVFSVLFVSNIFQLMDDVTVMELQGKSILAGFIAVNRLWIVMIPILAICIASIMRRFKSS